VLIWVRASTWGREGKPSAHGKQAEVPAICEMTFGKGKITSTVHYQDMFGILNQLGMLPAMDRLPPNPKEHSQRSLSEK